MGRKRTAGERRRQKVMKRAKRKEAGRRGASHRPGAERRAARMADAYAKAKAAMADGCQPKTRRIESGHYHVVVDTTTSGELRIGRARKLTGSRLWMVYDSHLVPDGSRFAKLRDAVKAITGGTDGL